MHEEEGARANDKGGETVQAEARHSVSRGVAEEIGQHAHHGRPADPTERVPQDEGVPGHSSGAGQPGRPDAQHEHEAPEEDGLRAVALEEWLADREHLQALAMKAARALEHPTPTVATDDVADVVADDRPRGGEG